MKEENEVAYIIAAKSGDSDAFSYMFKKYQPIVFKMQKKYYLRDLDREDWIQEGQIVCYQSLKNFKTCKGLTFGYFFKMNMERHVFSLLRKQNAMKRKTETQSTSLEEKMEQAGDSLVFTEDLTSSIAIDFVHMRDVLKDFHECLSKFESEIFHKFVLGYEVKKIAETCECAEDKVKNALDRVKRKLKNYIL